MRLSLCLVHALLATAAAAKCSGTGSARDWEPPAELASTCQPLDPVVQLCCRTLAPPTRVRDALNSMWVYYQYANATRSWVSWTRPMKPVDARTQHALGGARCGRHWQLWDQFRAPPPLRPLAAQSLAFAHGPTPGGLEYAQAALPLNIRRQCPEVRSLGGIGEPKFFTAGGRAFLYGYCLGSNYRRAASANVTAKHAAHRKSALGEPLSDADACAKAWFDATYYKNFLISVDVEKNEALGPAIGLGFAAQQGPAALLRGRKCCTERACRGQVEKNFLLFDAAILKSAAPRRLAAVLADEGSRPWWRSGWLGDLLGRLGLHPERRRRRRSDLATTAEEVEKEEAPPPPGPMRPASGHRRPAAPDVQLLAIVLIEPHLVYRVSATTGLLELASRSHSCLGFKDPIGLSAGPLPNPFTGGRTLLVAGHVRRGGIWGRNTTRMTFFYECDAAPPFAITRVTPLVSFRWSLLPPRI